jgi:hypothetical protein
VWTDGQWISVEGATPPEACCRGIEEVEAWSMLAD